MVEGGKLRVLKPLESVLVKPAGPDCNMACKYCFYLEKSRLFPETRVHRMSEKTLKLMVKQIMRQGTDNISFGWQGGEPTLMGRRFFELAFNYQHIFGRPGQRVGNGFQTNGILIDKDWAMMFKEYNFLVGLSLDGPKEIHDRYRVLKSGRPSWEMVVRARDIMLERGVAVNALSVVSDYSVKFPREIYEFHKKNGLTYMQFIPLLEKDPTSPDGIASFSVKPKDYGRFLCDIFDLWISDFKGGMPTTSVRWFDSLLFTYLGLEAPECTLQKECGRYVVIEHNGDVYSCDFFVENRWKLGNIGEGKIIDMLNSPLQDRFGKIKATLPEKCLKCPWIIHCYGDCPKHRINTPGRGISIDRPISYFCESYRMFFAHADKKFKELAHNVAQRQGGVF